MREKLALKNSSITFLCQISDILLQFVVRKLFIVYIGIEMLGINGTFTSILGALSVAELGFEAAVIYSLYKPIAEKKKEVVEDIVVILKRIYTFVGVFILVTGFIVMLFLPQILKGVEVNLYIYIVYYLQVMGVAITYFLGYKRTLIFALKRDYIRNIYISTYKLLASIVHIFVIISFSSYVGYVLVVLVQNLLTNISIARYCDKNFDYNFKNKKFNKQHFSKIFKDVKDIFWGRIAGYVYYSTDTLIISSLVGTVSVGFLSNYTQIFTQLKYVLNNVLNSNKPIIGELLAENNDKEHTLKVLRKYTFVRYLCCSVVFIPGAVLIDYFITAWISAKYVLPTYVTILITMDLYITFVHGALVDYIAGLGYFSYDKKISIIGAIMNLVISISLVFKWGIYGVLLGTVISQTFFWIARSIIVFKYYFLDLKTPYIKYWISQSIYILIFSFNTFIAFVLIKALPLGNSYLKVIIGGIICIVIVTIMNVLVLHRTEEYNFVKKLLLRLFTKYKRKILSR
ncbi:oligosaccharide flippase family protein [Priestia aryabhattai]|uniref:oligosaccharide flippase family protein n=1 Tax=Priestia aryabhattai TaxID=412384 RepID=UPI002E1C23CC|nr:oligosaccharide flippase family protein [Priestia aryabhattai]MED3957438.1 oligosaccharide flippase family protein [Priestia aryabhattai]